MRLLGILTALLAGPVLLACSDSGREGSGSATPVDGVVAVTAFEWGYEPEAITVPLGQRVRIDFSDDGIMTHNLKIDGLDAEAIESENDELFVEADDGESGTMTFTPTEQGEFEFYCDISGHRRRGMEGTLIVAGS